MPVEANGNLTGRAALPRRPNFHQNDRSDVLARVANGSASIAALAGDEIGANRQVCPTIVEMLMGVSSCAIRPSDCEFA
jgi:hypothetical protein